MKRITASILIAAGLLTSAAATTVAAAPKSPQAAARACRRVLGGTFGRLAALGFLEADRCQRRRAAGRTDRDCTTLRPGTPRSTSYRRWEHRTQEFVVERCPIDSPARAPFPAKDFGNDVIAGDPTASIASVAAEVEASARALHGASSAAVATRATAPGADCLAAIADARSLVARATMRQATRCQRRLDAAATTFDPLDPTCEGAPPDSAIRKAAGRIARGCRAASGADVGTCNPLPGCVVDSAVATGIALARVAYGRCGNGSVEGNEECDDGDDDPGDGCNHCIAPKCGNGRVEGDEECDDGNGFDHDTCTQCRNPICGDGIVDVGVEACDDGNAVPFDGCTECQSDPVPCSGAGVIATITIDYDPNAFVQIAGMRVRIRYDPDVVEIPGSLIGPSISQRVQNLTGVASGLSFSAADRDLLPSEESPDGIDDTLQTIAAISPGFVPPGPFERIRFDCRGTEARATQFECTVADVTDPFLNVVRDDKTAKFTQCSIELETAPAQ